MYGVPVSLTFKSDPQLKSTFGGCATLLSRLLIFIYLCSQLRSVLDNQYQLQTSLLSRDLTIDQTYFNLTLADFDFAIRLDYTFGNLDPQVRDSFD